MNSSHDQEDTNLAKHDAQRREGGPRQVRHGYALNVPGIRCLGRPAAVDQRPSNALIVQVVARSLLMAIAEPEAGALDRNR